jgi:hypothetical protein
MKIKHLSIIAFVIGTMASCSKDRIEVPEYSYTNADSFFEQNKEKEQVFVITTDTGGCIVARKGTEICSNRAGLRKSNGDTVGLPYTLKVVELYSNKDLLLYKFPTSAASNETLKSDAAIRIVGEKDGGALTINTPNAVSATLSKNPARTGNSLFNGTNVSDVFTPWTSSADGSSLATANNKNVVGLNAFKWFSAAQTNTASKTTIGFELTGKGGESLDLWLLNKSNSTVLHGKNLKVENVPVGEEFTAVVIAMNQDNKMVLHKNSFVVTANYKVVVKFEEKSETEVLTYLETL